MVYSRRCFEDFYELLCVVKLDRVNIQIAREVIFIGQEIGFGGFYSLFKVLWLVSYGK